MAFDIFMQCLPRHVAVHYAKLKSITIKMQRTVGSIGSVQKSLHNKFVPTFAKLKGHFVNRNDKLRAEQAILKSHLVEHKKYFRTLCLGHDEISNIIKSNYGRTFHKLCIINIISALHKENKLQLRCKNLRLFRLIPRKKDSQYQVPVLNLSTENINTTPLRYGLHHSFTDKNKYVKRNVAVELQTLARVLDAHITHTEKEYFHEYLCSATNIITKNVYSDV